MSFSKKKISRRYTYLRFWRKTYWFFYFSVVLGCPLGCSQALLITLVVLQGVSGVKVADYNGVRAGYCFTLWGLLYSPVSLLWDQYLSGIGQLWNSSCVGLYSICAEIVSAFVSKHLLFCSDETYVNLFMISTAAASELSFRASHSG